MSTVAKKVIMGSGAVEAAYEIDQSLIFSSTNDYLQKSPSSAGNRRTFTLSYWVKITTLAGASRVILSAGTDNTDVFHHNFESGGTPDDALRVVYYASSAFQINLTTNRVFRDPSAWYHIVLAIDTTQGTAANRVKIYVNGVQETSFATSVYPDQNLELNVNNTVQHRLGQYHGTDFPLKSYLAETHFIDGAAKAPSDFGETNSDTGQWIPKKYSGSYGTNGFYLKFVSGALGTDSSGEGNNYTAANLANSDVVIDTPTNNFATLNPIFISGDTNTFSEGNLKVVMATGAGGLTVATIVPTAGKYYAEFKMTAGDPSYGYMGVTPVTTNSKAPAYMTAANNSYAYYGYNGQIIEYPNDTVLSTEASYGVNDVVGIAIDYDNSTIKWYKNNALQYTKTSAVLKDVTFGMSDTSSGAGQTVEVNFGQKAFAYTPPSGYVALSTANLPDPAIALPSAHFNTVLYTGSGGAQTISGVGFQPDFSWTKSRSEAKWHRLVNAVRGSNKALFSNDTYAEVNDAGGQRAMTFESDGFAWGGNSDDVNGSGKNYVSWNWKANGSGSTDTSGDVDCVLSANPTAGFSVLSFTGNGSNNDTIPHGLGVVPDFVWYKAGDSSWENWIHSSIISGNKRLLLQGGDAASSINSNYLIGGEIATSSMISNNALTTSQAVVAWCFASKPGYSKIGTYIGNGSATAGPFVNLGFKPAFVIRRNITGAGEWWMQDIERTPNNISKTALRANTSAAEVTSGDDSYGIDILSNGFRVFGAAAYLNGNGQSYLYMAFAESPFKYANAH